MPMLLFLGENPMPWTLSISGELWSHGLLYTSFVAFPHVRSSVRRREKTGQCKDMLILNCCCAASLTLLVTDVPHTYDITEVLLTLLKGLTLASRESILEPSGTISYRHKESFWCLLTEDTQLSPKPNRCMLLPYMLMLCRFIHLVWVGVSLFFACFTKLWSCQNCCMHSAVKIEFFYFHYMQKLPVSVVKNTSGISSSPGSLLFINFLQ